MVAVDSPPTKPMMVFSSTISPNDTFTSNKWPYMVVYGLPLILWYIYTTLPPHDDLYVIDDIIPFAVEYTSVPSLLHARSIPLWLDMS